MKDNDIIVTATGALGIYHDGKITTTDGDPLEKGCEEFILRMIPGDPDTLKMNFGETEDGIRFPETKAGSRGLTVALLQQALACRGYYNAKIDGDFGELTHAALYRYRKETGFSGDTVADMQVYKKLFEEN